jgi:hypothetical protein
VKTDSAALARVKPAGSAVRKAALGAEVAVGLIALVPEQAVPAGPAAVVSDGGKMCSESSVQEFFGFWVSGVGKAEGQLTLDTRHSTLREF